MNNLESLAHVFEKKLLTEMLEVSPLMRFKEGDVIIDYGKYVRMMPIGANGSGKVEICSGPFPLSPHPEIMSITVMI